MGNGGGEVASPGTRRCGGSLLPTYLRGYWRASLRDLDEGSLAFLPGLCGEPLASLSAGSGRGEGPRRAQKVHSRDDLVERVFRKLRSLKVRRGSGLQSGVFAVEPGIQTQRSGSAGGDVEEHEAVGDYDFAVVKNRPEAELSVHQEVGEGHLSRGEQRDGRCKQTQRDHEAAYEFNHSGQDEQSVRISLAAKQTKDFLHAVADQHESHHDAHQRVG